MKRKNSTFTWFIAAVVALSLSAYIGANAAGDKGDTAGVREVTSLKTAKVPPVSFAGYLKNNPEAEKAAIELGKALFWDMQAGGDGKQACASCHFDAGADSRYKGQLNPGAAHAWQGLGDGSAANYILAASDYPFHKVANPDDRNSAVISDTPHATGSQGLHRAEFVDVTPGKAEDAARVVPQSKSPDLFGVAEVNNSNVRVSTRTTTARNTPSVINAVFNYRNFYDGRAQNTFNGVSPAGELDRYAFLLAAKDGKIITRHLQPAHQKIAIKNASLASQAVGPPNNDVEMSYLGRDFKRLGKKMLSLKPLAQQLVAADDSVLGPHSNQRAMPGAKGLNTSYRKLIETAFESKWWDSDQLVDAEGNLVMSPLSQRLVSGAPANSNEFTLMEYNFSLFWGIAIQMYESTLISDDSAFDRYMDGDSAALSPQEQAGLIVFIGKGNCMHCHMGPEMTDAAVGNQPYADIGSGGNPARGFHNLGVRPVADLQATASGAPGAITTAVKTPGLRNVELTAPYFHNGSQLTLEQVVDFYARGGDFGQRGVDVDMDINFFRFKMTPTDKSSLVAFLKALTDRRVLMQSAPFDHPSIDVPNGASGNNSKVRQNGESGLALDDEETVFHVAATGKSGTSKPFVTYAQHLR